MRIKSVMVKLLILMLADSICLESRILAQVQPTQLQKQQAAVRLGGLPLTFEANQGQSDPNVKFFSKGKGYTAFLTANGMLLTLRPSSGVARQPLSGSAAPVATLQFALVGASANPTVVGEDLQPGKINYFFGNDPTKWRTGVATYARIRYHNVYPGIDIVYYGNHRQLEFDFAISPGADPSQIQFQVQGAKGLDIDQQGDLVLDTGNGELHFRTPTTYQEANGTRVPVQGSYVLKDSTHVGFQLSRLDPTKPTVIDPVLVYGTYLGGSGDDEASGVAVDSSGNVYISGTTDSTDFPLAIFGSLPAGNSHVFVAKLDSTGSTLLYADYLGGNTDDYGYGLAVDGSGEVYLTGSTTSSDFPMVNAYNPTYPGGTNAFVTKLSSDGSILLYSTYFGGNGSDLPATIAVDSSGNMLIAGSTTSTNLPTVDAYQSTASANQGGQFGTYGFVTKFSPDGSELVYSTYFAGSSNVSYTCGVSTCWPQPYSAIASMAVDSSGNAFVGGSTTTYNFPTTANVYETSSYALQNGLAGFLGKFSSSGELVYSTYLDETSGIVTTINAVAVDASGSAYVTGGAFSDGSFPLSSTSICDPSVYSQLCGFGFVTKFNATASSLLYSTFLGPNNLSTPVAIALDASNNAYVAGSTNDTSFSSENGIEAFSTEGSQYQAGIDYDVLLAEIDSQASSELFASYLGGSGNNVVASIALDADANIYVAGSTDSIDFPISQGSYQEVVGGNTDSFIVKIAPTDAAAVSVTPFSLDYEVQSLGTSTAQTVLLRNMGSTALNITSIAASPDFTQTNNCGSSVPAAGTCTLSVTFTPRVVGADSGSVSIVDDAAGSPHVINLSGTGTGPAVTLAPASLTFAALTLGTSSAGQSVILTNSGDQSLTIGTIQASGDYAQTNNCSVLLAPEASCSIQVTFTPTVAGTRAGVLTIADGAFDSPQAITLTGTGQATLGITVSSATLNFATQPLDSTSAGQTITVTNEATSAAVISNISIAGNFSQTNNCGTVAANGGTCSVIVKFSPSTSGALTGTLAITSGSSIPPVSLSGTGVDFSLTSSTNSVSISDGSTATYKLTVTPVKGSFASAIQLSCAGQPTGATCAFSPSVVTPDASPVSVTLTITTAASTSQLAPSRRSPTYLAFATWLQLPGLGLMGIVFAGPKRRSKNRTMLGALILVIVALLFMSACAGGTGIVSSGNQNTPQTYSVSATGTSGSLKHSVPLTLNVQ
ncbi:MAG TPA: SBBP repeat-containing protein [Candidatus Sulfotelmatobacter sp.]